MIAVDVHVHDAQWPPWAGFWTAVILVGIIAIVLTFLRKPRKP